MSYEGIVVKLVACANFYWFCISYNHVFNIYLILLGAIVDYRKFYIPGSDFYVQYKVGIN